MASVDVSSVVRAEIGRVWSVVRDFNGMPGWHPLISDSRIETGAPSDQVGCVRNFTLTDGGRIRERLLSLSDREHSFWYEIVESPMPISNYVAGLELSEVSEADHTFGRWRASFDCSPDVESEMSALISRDVFGAGFEALNRMLG